LAFEHYRGGIVEGPARSAPIRNRLLEGLPPARRSRVIACCERVQLAAGESLAEPGAEMRSVYFPTGSSISLLMPVAAEIPPEAELTGSEGFYGISVALGVSISAVHARVQEPGSAWRMASGVFRRELTRNPPLRDRVDRYTFVTMARLMRNAGCNRFHVVLQRVARRLLMTADRAHASTFRLTHESRASVLGVRRVGVTVAASFLQQRRLIEYSRGTVTVLDRAGLERASCSCYREDAALYRRYLG
jgi:CRP-like cAMP-binding protein